MEKTIKNDSSLVKTSDGNRSHKGRKRGSKSGLPFTRFSEAVTYAKTLWNAKGDSEMTPSDIAKDLGFKLPKAVRVIGALNRNYNILEKIGKLWKLSDIGRGVANNDKDALMAAFTNEKMFKELFNEFNGRKVTDEAIASSIKSRYKYVDADEVKERLKEGMELLKDKAPAKSANLKGMNEKDLQTIVKLKYALMPPKPEEISELEDKAIEIFERMGNETLNTLADLMKQNKNNKDVFLQLLQQAFPKVGIDSEDIKTKKKEVTNENG